MTNTTPTDLHTIRMALKTQAFTRRIESVIRAGGDAGRVVNLIDDELDRIERKASR